MSGLAPEMRRVPNLSRDPAMIAQSPSWLSPSTFSLVLSEAITTTPY